MTTNPELAPDMPKQIWANDSGRKEDGSCNTGTWSAFDTPRAGPYATPSSAPQKYKRTPYIRADLAPQAGSVDVEAVIDAVTSFYTRKEDRNFAAQVARNTLDNLLAGAPVGGDDGLHSKIEMDIEDAISRELTFDESRIVGLSITGAQNPEKPQWWKDIEWLAELRKPQSPRPAIPGLQEAIGDFGMAEDYWANGENFVPLASTCKVVRELLQAARQSGVPDKYIVKTDEDGALEFLPLVPEGYVVVPREISPERADVLGIPAQLYAQIISGVS